jgi:antitoxin MazE
MAVQLDEGDTVQVLVDNGAIVIRPSRPRYSLDELVRRITPKNRHDESDWGGPLGDEVWGTSPSASRSVTTKHGQRPNCAVLLERV